MFQGGKRNEDRWGKCDHGAWREASKWQYWAHGKASAQDDWAREIVEQFAWCCSSFKLNSTYNPSSRKVYIFLISYHNIYCCYLENKTCSRKRRWGLWGSAILRGLLGVTHMVEPGSEQIFPFPGQCSFRHLVLLKVGQPLAFNSHSKIMPANTTQIGWFFYKCTSK